MRIGDYLVMDKLGRGGMGQVYSAVRFREPNFAMPCAIKLLHRELASERSRFFEEARIAAQLDHGRIVKVLDVGEFRECPYLVMEWVDGVSLRTFVDKLRERGDPLPLDLDLVNHIVGEVLAALEYAHERTIAGLDAGVIHHDVTPGNIMISSSGEIKLTDFGIARFAVRAGPLSRWVGTPRYMAAEQMTGHPCRATDIYSLGVVLHELIDDERYLDGHSPAQFRARVLHGPPPGVEREVPAWLDSLRQQMLQPVPEDRPTAKQARSSFRGHAGDDQDVVHGLEVIYRRCIGPRRSGYTGLHQTGGGDESLRSMLARQVDRRRREPKEPHEEHERASKPAPDVDAAVESSLRRPRTPWGPRFVGGASSAIAILLMLVIVLALARTNAASTPVPHWAPAKPPTIDRSPTKPLEREKPRAPKITVTLEIHGAGGEPRGRPQ